MRQMLKMNNENQIKCKITNKIALKKQKAKNKWTKRIVRMTQGGQTEQMKNGKSLFTDTVHPREKSSMIPQR